MKSLTAVLACTCARRSIEAMVRAKMEQKEYIILCLEDSNDWSNATTRRLVMQVGRLRDTSCSPALGLEDHLEHQSKPRAWTLVLGMGLGLRRHVAHGHAGGLLASAGMEQHNLDGWTP